MIDSERLMRLRKGDVIEGGDVLLWLGMLEGDVRPGSVPPEVRLAIAIEDGLHKVGRFWTVKAVTGAVMVLTDAQALAHNVKRHRAGLNKFRRAVACVGGIDTKKMTSEEIRDFETFSRKISAQYLAIKSARSDPSAMVRPLGGRTHATNAR